MAIRAFGTRLLANSRPNPSRLLGPKGVTAHELAGQALERVHQCEESLRGLEWALMPAPRKSASCPWVARRARSKMASLQATWPRTCWHAASIWGVRQTSATSMSCRLTQSSRAGTNWLTTPPLTLAAPPRRVPTTGSARRGTARRPRNVPRAKTALEASFRYSRAPETSQLISPVSDATLVSHGSGPRSADQPVHGKVAFRWAVPSPQGTQALPWPIVPFPT